MKLLQITYINQALENKTNILIPCLEILSPEMPEKALIVLCKASWSPLYVAKRRDGYYAISSLLWSDAEIQINAGSLQISIVKSADCAMCSFVSEKEFVIASQFRSSLTATTPVKQSSVQLRLGESVGVRESSESK